MDRDETLTILWVKRPSHEDEFGLTDDYAVDVLSKLLCSEKSDYATFRVSRRRREMYCGHARLCVCLSNRGRMPTLLHGPGCNLEEW